MNIDVHATSHHPETPEAMMLEFLTWVARKPRTYEETMDAWRSNCPRFPVWEDAHGMGLVRVQRPNGSSGPAPVILTASGRSLLQRR
jgi:hypothetical protein